jgi:hypothetical protein
MSRYHNFDAAWDESQEEPIKFTALGEEFELPSEIPAAAALRVIRLQKQFGSELEIPRAEFIELACSVIGQEALDRLMAKNITLPRLEQITSTIMRMYMGDDPNLPTPEKEAGEKELPTNTSLKTGGESKPTSSENTG